MFQKILVAEDIDSINISVIQAMEQLGVKEIHHAKYCDEALLKIKKAQFEKQPYQLLITDLSFRPDHRPEKLSSGEDLIQAARSTQPELKILAYSIEDKSYKIRSLLNNHKINGYIIKGRNSIPELQKAVSHIKTEDGPFLSKEVTHVLSDKTLLEIGSYDLTVLKLLSQGLILEEIAAELKKQNIAPNSDSSVEKRIGKLKVYFRAANNVQLIAIAKDFGLI